MAGVSRVRVYLGCSLDGFIAGPDNDLGWLNKDYGAEGDLPPDAKALGFDAFMAQVGAILMGRTTYDVLLGLGAWPYGNTPMIVATHRPIPPTPHPVRTAAGTMEELIREAKTAAGGRDVYLDGGALVRQAIQAGLVDEMCLTFIPVLVGKGIRLFESLASMTQVQFISHHTHEHGMVQLTVRMKTGRATS